MLKPVARSDRVRQAQPVVLAALAQFGASLGMLVSNFGGESTPLWPASGISVAAILLLGKGAWLGIAIGSCAATLMNGVNLPASAAVGIGRGLGALAGAAFIRRFSEREGSMQPIWSTVGILLAAIFAPTISNAVALASLGMAGNIPWKGMVALWGTWWITGATGILVLTPAISSLPDLRLRGWTWARGARAAAVA